MWDAISGFGSSLFSMLDTAVSSSDRRAANELNYWSSMDTNKTNAIINAEQLAAARENWKREQQNFELQRKWALEDRDYENWYNLPSNVRDRFLKAGINPVLAMQGSGTGIGSSGASTKQSPSPQFGSPPSSIPMQAVHFEPTYNGGIGLGIQKAIETYLLAQRNESDIAATKQRIDNETAETMAKIRSYGKNDEYSDELVRKLRQEWQFNKDTYSERMKTIQLGNDKLIADKAYTEAETASVEFANSIAPELHNWNRQLFAQNLSIGAAQIAELNSRTDLNSEQKELVGKQVAEQVIVNSNLPKQLHNENAIRVATYNQIMKQGSKIEQETKNLQWEEKDLRKGYRQHFGNNRSLEDIIDVTLKRDKRGASMPSMQQ